MVKVRYGQGCGIKLAGSTLLECKVRYGRGVGEGLIGSVEGCVMVR